MPELRQDFATKEWVIIATERAKRPEDFVKERSEPDRLPERDDKCPFCPGNERMTPEETYALRNGSGPNEPGWLVRVVPNKFPALVPDSRPYRSRSGLYLRMKGVGFHEVVIETPRHDKCPATLTEDEMTGVVSVYKQRYSELNRNPTNELILIFRNQGKQAGTSLIHPHSQIVATPIVPPAVRRTLYEAERFYDAMGRCVHCEIVNYELRVQERVVMDEPDFVVLVPYAAQVPFELTIIPKFHQASFGEIPDDKIGPFARVLWTTLRKLYYGLKNPDYNFAIITAPHYSQGEPHAHWHLRIRPRLTTPAGFEMGTQIFINTSLPEENAHFLRQVSIPEPSSEQ
ncbi:MAG: galactose-1-phosphate uridylyltransferase [Armatimonadetes bacterium]|nr:galactose-1-phosphate uridylyltransferase [Armatimonadota bacterium]MDW8122220.1 galactose-1-phosphate uridylyltransferase [Armatimonadota bacterium]